MAKAFHSLQMPEKVQEEEERGGQGVDCGLRIADLKKPRAWGIEDRAKDYAVGGWRSAQSGGPRFRLEAIEVFFLHLYLLPQTSNLKPQTPSLSPVPCILSHTLWR